jgi:DNA polymerase III subunit gamma/tau
VKIVPATADNVAFSETERIRARDFATKLSMRVLSRVFQMLLKGITEAQAATRPAAAAEMVLVRIAYVADLPTPDEAIRMIAQNGGASPAVTSGAPSRGMSAPTASANSSAPARAAAAPRPVPEASVRPQMAPEANAAPARKISSFPELVALAGENRDLMMKSALESDVRLVRIEDGRLEIALERQAQRTLVNELSRKLEQWTNRRWTVVVSNEAGQSTLREQNLIAKSERERAAEADPRVKEVLARFPGSKLVEVRRLAAEPPESDASAEALGEDGFTGEGPDDSDDDF